MTIRNYDFLNPLYICYDISVPWNWMSQKTSWARLYCVRLTRKDWSLCSLVRYDRWLLPYVVLETSGLRSLSTRSQVNRANPPRMLGKEGLRVRET